MHVMDKRVSSKWLPIAAGMVIVLLGVPVFYAWRAWSGRKSAIR